MYTDLNKQMEEAQQGINRLNKIEHMLEELRKERAEKEAKVRELEWILEEEEADVSKLEHTSLSKMFYSVLGNLESKVEKEQKEALAARLKYEQAVRDLEQINYEMEKLLSERTIYQNCESDYTRLYHKKKELLIQSHSGAAEEVMELTNKRNQAKSNLKEIEEAISVGKSVLGSLSNALESLNSAQGWGTWDMLGGGLVSSMAKHSHIDQAKIETERTQELLRRFKTELTDIRIDQDFNVDISGFSKFADFFFDGLIADWFVQSKIHHSQDSIYQVQNQVNGVMTKLRMLKGKEENEISRTQKRMDDLITNA